MTDYVMEPVWLKSTDNSCDVVISTFCRLHRNLSGYPFSEKMSQSDKKNIQDNLSSTISSEHFEFEEKQLKNLSNAEKRILIEKQILQEQYIIDPTNTFFHNNDQSVFIFANTDSHVTFLGLTPGLSGNHAFKKISRIEKKTDKYLNYSFSMEYGFLFEDIYSFGTGLKTGIIVHLPALQEAEIITKISHQLLKAGCEITGFFSEDEDSMGALYFIEISPEIRLNEKDLLEKLESVGQQILHYEREARNDYLGSRKLSLEDSVCRSYGVLKHCRKISAEEAVLRISDLRLGVLSNVLDLPINKLTPLFFTIHKAHICRAFNLKESECDDRIESLRADYIKSVLFSAN